MPKLLCKCNNSLNLGEIPNPIEYLFVSDVEYNELTGAIDSEKVFDALKHFVRCPYCGRIWVFWDGFQANPTCYRLEE